MLNNREDIAKLKAKAARYRALAQATFDSRTLAEVQACVREIDSQAASLEQNPPSTAKPLRRLFAERSLYRHPADGLAQTAWTH